MKITIGVVIALLLLLLVMLFAGWLGVYVYGAIEWVGHLFSTGVLPDGRAAFRAGLLLGGLVSVGALLRVAIMDKSHEYAGAGLFVAFAFALLLFFTRVSPFAKANDEARSLMFAESTPAGKPIEIPEWYSRSSYERDAAGKVHALARAAARGDQQRVDAGLEELQRWARRGVRIGGDREAFNAARERFNATFDMPAGRAKRDKLGRLRHEALRAMWQAVPEVDVAGRRVLVQDLAVFAFALRLRAERSPTEDEDPREGELLDDKLIELVRLQEAILGYAPRSAEFWSIYAATIVDADEEVALGALLIADQLRRSAGSGYSAMTMSISDEMLFQSDMRVSTGLLPEASIARLGILKARAAAMVGKAVSASGGSSALVEGAKTSSPEQVLPAAQYVHTGKGLLPSPRLMPPMAMPMESAEMMVWADLLSAGFEQKQRPVALPSSGISSDSSLRVAVDVLADGSISSVLIERSSGDPALDDATRAAARRWKATLPIAAEGERRRVQVRFEAPPRLETLSDRPPPPMVPGRDVGAAPSDSPPSPPVSRATLEYLQELLASKARFNPPRYPSAAWSEGVGGRVVLAITLSGAGEVRNVVVANSSGNALLDKAAREAALGWSVSPEQTIANVGEVTLRMPVVFKVE